MRELGFPGAGRCLVGSHAFKLPKAGKLPETGKLPKAGSTAGAAWIMALLASSAMASSTARAQEADNTCSGFNCLLKIVTPSDGWLSSPKPVSPDPAVQPAGAAISEKARKAPKPPRPIITIAVPSAEMTRLKGLATALPQDRIRIVPTLDASEAVDADFTVSDALGAAGTHGKAKLFAEQLHIVAGEKTRTVADLAGKMVGIAGDGGSSDAVRRAFAALDVKVKDTPLDLANALDGLATGDLDAVVVLAPQPVTQLENIKAPGLHLVSWPDQGSVPEGASLTSIEGDRYPSLTKPGETIRTVGVDAVLTMSAKGAKDPAARAFLGSLTQNATALSKHGFDRLKADNGQRSADQVASADRH